MEKKGTLQTTLGELIAALAEEATKIVGNEHEAYQMVAFALAHLLHSRSAVC